MFDDETLLRMCYALSWKSPDPHTKIGALIIDKDGQIISTGWNRQLINEMPIADKQTYTDHAETQALWAANSVLRGDFSGTTLFASSAACGSCARAIIGLGVPNIVTHGFFQSLSNPWADEIEKAQNMLREAGCLVTVVEPPLTGCVAFLSGSEYQV